MTNPHSTAKIAGHPIHPMLIPFPIAFFVGTLVCDLVYWATESVSWSRATLWLLAAGLIIAALAAVAGLTDFVGDRAIRQLSDAWWHAGGNAAVVALSLLNWAIRYAFGSEIILPWGLVISFVVVGILLFTGWKGWDMVYRYHVGVADEGEGQVASPRELIGRGRGSPVMRPSEKLAFARLQG